MTDPSILLTTIQDDEVVTKKSVWERLGLSEDACAGIKRLGFRNPTPIQRKMIPAVLRRQGDLVAMARTGSGKTAAFLLPMITLLREHRTVVGARALIVSPSRELASQTARVCYKLCGRSGLRLTSLVGGQSIQTQFDHLSHNPDILVATPGRLVHVVEEATYELSRVEIAVFDEADQLFELGFEEQLNFIVRSLTLTSRQCILTSATLPTKLVHFTKMNLINPEFIQIDADCQLSENLQLDFFYCRSEDKLAAFVFWITLVKEAKAKAIVFCATVHHVNFLYELLMALGIESCALAGRNSQEQRSEALRGFNTEAVHVLLATDVAARGIDISDMPYVFHYDFPGSSKVFLHRSGRTARLNKAGTAVSLVTKDDLPLLQELLVFLGRSKKEQLLLGGFPNLDFQRELIDNALKKDTGLVRLFRSMQAGHKCYLQWISRQFSASSIREAGALLRFYGGPQELSRSVHPKLKDIQNHLTESTLKVAPTVADGLDQIFGQEKKSTATVEVAEVLHHDKLTSFRPTRTEASSRGMGVSKVAKEDMRSIVAARANVKVCVSEALTEGDPEQPDLWTALQSVENQVEPLKQKDIPSDFFLGAETTEQERELNAVNRMQEASMELAPDLTNDVAQKRHVRRWNPSTKKFEIVPIDGNGRRVTTKTKKSEAKGSQYARWRKQTKQRVQRVGELEDSGIMKMAVERTNDFASIQEDPALAEKIKSNIRLTHKEKRKLQRLKTLQEKSLSGEAQGTQLLAYDELRARAKQRHKNKLKQDKGARAVASKISKEKHMNKRRMQAKLRSRPSRSLVLRRS